MAIVRIISGGQTGVDQAALDAAIHCNIPHGGWCPRGRKSEAGRIPDRYELKETASQDYPARTEANVVDSDATLVLTPGPPTRGSRLTIDCCIRHRKPWLHIAFDSMSELRAAEQVRDWLAGDVLLNDYGDYAALPPEQCVLNVAGSRGSQLKTHPNRIINLLLAAIWKTNGTLFYPLPVPEPDIIE